MYNSQKCLMFQGFSSLGVTTSACSCSSGRNIDTDAAVPTFFLQCSVHAVTFDPWLGMIGLDVMPTPRSKLYLNQYRVCWTYPFVVHGPVDMITLKTFILEGKTRIRE